MYTGKFSGDAMREAALCSRVRSSRFICPARNFWLSMRAAAQNPVSSRLVGVRVGVVGAAALSQKAIAARFALPIQTVREAQRLGRLHPDVMAAYKECDWREPNDPQNSLQATASQVAGLPEAPERWAAIIDTLYDGLYTASSGNSALAMTWMAKRLGLDWRYAHVSEVFETVLFGQIYC